MLRFPLLWLFSFVMRLVGLLLLLGGTALVGYSVWMNFGAADWQAVLADPMVIIDNVEYRLYATILLGSLFVGFLFAATGELVRIMFNIERNTERMVAGLTRMSKTPRQA